MSFRVRCPHCKATLTAADQQAGLPGHCSECGKKFIMPLPVSEAGAIRATVATRCVRCRADLAPGTTICPRCSTDQATGHRVSLTRRLARTSFRTWTIAGATLLLAGLAGWIGVETWRNLKRAPVASAPPPPASQPSSGSAVQQLFAAKSTAARNDAVHALTALGADAAEPLLARLAKLSPGERDPQTIFNVTRAIELLANLGSSAGPSAVGVLRDLQRNPPLRIEAIRAGAMLGDAAVSADAAAEWIDLTRKRLYYERLARLTPAEAADADRAMLARTAEAADRLADGLHALAQSPESTVVGTLLESLFPSWSWLGQERDERYGAAVWEASKPPRDADADFRHRVRAARRVLDRTSQTASAGARAAAGIVLAASGPQYETLRREIVQALAGQLSDCPPLDQQRVTWALARLAGQRFGDVTGSSAPQDVERTAVLAALEWVRSNGLANPPPLRTARESYPPPPLPMLRVVTAERQLEEALLREIDSGWAQAEQASDRWVRAGLGLTPRLGERLDPAQREPKLFAVTAAIVIAAESGAVAGRTRLDLWAKSADQPAWLRGFAGTALAALDARGGRVAAGWPGELSAGDLEFTAERPSARLWGRLIGAGGPTLVERLRKERRALPAPLRDTLLKAAEQAAARNRKGA